MDRLLRFLSLLEGGLRPIRLGLPGDWSVFPLWGFVSELVWLYIGCSRLARLAIVAESTFPLRKWGEDVPVRLQPRVEKVVRGLQFVCTNCSPCGVGS